MHGIARRHPLLPRWGEGAGVSGSIALFVHAMLMIPVRVQNQTPLYSVQ